jgi:integrase
MAAKKGRHVIGKLTARTVQTAKFPPKWHADGGGLYLRVTKGMSKAWVFAYTSPAKPGARREMGLGSYPDVGLEAAREAAAECRRLVKAGVDPIEKRRADKLAKAMERAKAMTFNDCARAYIEANRSGWKNAKHAAQWASTLEAYASPIGTLPVAEVDTALVVKVLEPIWAAKPETASRLRGRIEAVLAWASVAGYRTGDNPARWRGHLDKLLPKRSKVAAVRHHPALPYRRVGEFMAALRQREGMAARALEFVILTAARSGEVRGATWQEIDWEARLWIVPSRRMKASKEHRVPLSDAALDLLENLPRFAGCDLIFPAPMGGMLSDMSLTAVIRRMQGDGAPTWTDEHGEPIVVHGFRSAFRDWAGEVTGYAREVIEHALAHRLKDKAEASYARGTLLEKRRRLMADWAAYCAAVNTSNDANVIAIRGGAD